MSTALLTREAPVTPDADAAIAAMEQQFPTPESQVFDYNTIIAVGGAAVDNETDNWVAVGRARIPGNAYQDVRPLSVALEADLTAKAEGAGFNNYALEYTQRAEMQHFMDQLSELEDDEDDESFGSTKTATKKKRF